MDARVLQGTKIRSSKDVLVTRLGDEVAILDLRSERYFGLDPVGTNIWEALTTASSVGAAVDALLAVYDVDRPTLMRDVVNLVTRLKDRGLLEVSDEASK